MAFPYTVVSGDTLSGIARKHGIADWRVIYNAPENATFRRKRPDPNRIFPGDMVMIPGRTAPGACGPPVVTPPTPRFTVQGRPKTLNPIRPTFDPDKVIIKAGLRQFEWKPRVILDQPGSDCLLVGILQTMFHNKITADYSAPGQDPRPRQGEVRVNPLPIRDHQRAKTLTFDWANNAVTPIGHCAPGGTLPLPPKAGGLVDIQQADLDYGDDPGGRFPLNHPNAKEKLLRKVAIEHDFVTWVAVRAVTANASDLRSYQFLQFCRWTVRRSFTITYRDSGPVGQFIANETKVVELGNGKGSSTPVLVPPDANGSAQLVFP